MGKANNSVPVTENCEDGYRKYEELLLKRDQLFRECGSIMTAYTKEFGDLITANFKLKAECIKKQKTMSYCRRRMNRGLTIDQSRMQAEIEQEMTHYYSKLKAMEGKGDVGFERNYDEIDTRIELVENQINEILTTEPYIYKELLGDEEKMREYREQLQAEHEDYEQYLEHLTGTLEEMHLTF